jgi:hypothetical protein
VACAAVENAHRFGAENSVERVAQIVEESLDKIRST